MAQDTDPQTAFVALLRAVNVGGTGKLPMADLKAIAEAAGLKRVRTYIASGNLVFDSALSEAAVKQTLEQALERYAGKPVAVMVRTAAQMRAALDGNPFPDRAANRTMAVFLDAAPPADTLDRVVAPGGEEVRLGLREIYIHYGEGMGQSKLKVPAAKAGTARNINTVAKLAEMAASRP
jgi:uncharacterized protein (DUF1697 family)